MYRNLQPIVLASGSPRRREFLENLGLDFSVVVAEIPEAQVQGETPYDFVGRMARQKALAVAPHFSDTWVIGGDTIVCLGDLIFGKPASRDEAVEQLMQLTGKTHTVRSGFCVCNYNKNVVRTDVVVTKVRFASFSRKVASAYVATGEPMDKAGAYGIQGIGGALVESIDGSYSGVVGLPLVELVAVLEDERVVVPVT